MAPPPLLASLDASWSVSVDWKLQTPYDSVLQQLSLTHSALASNSEQHVRPPPSAAEANKHTPH